MEADPLIIDDLLVEVDFSAIDDTEEDYLDMPYDWKMAAGLDPNDYMKEKAGFLVKEKRKEKVKITFIDNLMIEADFNYNENRKEEAKV